MAILSLNDIYLSYSAEPLFDHTDLAVDANDRIAVVGRNGAGKSTLLKVIEGLILPDDGRRIVQQNIRIARLEQDPPAHLELPVYSYVAKGIDLVGDNLAEFFEVSNSDNFDEFRITNLSAEIEAKQGWKYDVEIRRILSLLGLDPLKSMASLSGGWLRKVALARALVYEPNLLLLDEPTNHLDIATIEWLQDFIKNFNGAVVFISHDRSFINAIATKIIDVDRGKISSFLGNYETFVEGKREALRLEEIANADFDRILSQEEAWIRKGIKARLTRSDSRVRRLKEMRVEHKARRGKMGNVNLRIDDKELSGKIVIEAENLCLNLGGKNLVKDFSALVLRGDKIGVVGANGCGKTSFIKMLLGELTPTSGKLKIGSNLQIAYFDQYREQLDLEKTVMDNLAHGKTEVEVAGKKQHVLGYLQDFLFSPQRSRTPVKALSGGEKNRLLLARIFLRPCNLLILDEPTNDLDIETLDLLEELLTEFKATLIVVSHDRYFLDNVVTDTWYFDGSGKIEQFIGGYSDLKETLLQRELSNQAVKPIVEKVVKSSKPVVERKRKLSYKERQELDKMPLLIEELEAKIEQMEQLFGSAEYGAADADYKKNVQQDYDTTNSQLENAYSRWEELDAIEKA